MIGQHERDEDLEKRMTALDDLWLSVRQAANYAGVCEKTVRRAYLARQVQHTCVGRAVRFRRAWIDAWMLKAEVIAVV